MSKRFCVVFYKNDRTSDVVNETSINDTIKVGEMIKVQWEDGYDYEAKLLFVGTKLECDKKIKYVTKDGTLKERRFSITSTNDPVNMSPIPTSSTPVRDTVNSLNQVMDILRNMDDKLNSIIERQDDLQRRMRSVENSSSGLTSFENKVRSSLNSIESDLYENREKTSQILRRLPEKVSASIDYVFCGREEVENMRLLCPDYKKFSQKLELIVYRGEEEQLKVLVEKRVTTADRVEFIKQCVQKCFHIHVENREIVWRDVRQTLNQRVRRLLRCAPSTPSRTQSTSTPTRSVNLDYSFGSGRDVFDFDG